MQRGLRLLLAALIAGTTLMGTHVLRAQPPGLLGGFAPGGEPVVTVKAQFTRPGQDGVGQLSITARIKSGWHIYSITQPVEQIGPKPTKITIPPSSDYQVPGPFQASPAPRQQRQKELDNLLVETHEGQVTWRGPIRFAPGVDPATLKISGSVRAQPCTETSCLPPQDFRFVAELAPGSAGAPPQAAIPAAAPPAPPPSTSPPWPGDAGTSAGYSATDPGAIGPFELTDAQQLKDTSTLTAMLLGFAGGLILNLMPCVLPVIGLKIFSFMQQAGHSRRQAFLLNVWYSLGLLSVFLALALLSVAVGLGWGQLFSYKGFTITMAAVVFAMGLSFLGVWEIPIPGFIGAGKTNEWAEQEGPAGAFAKGVLTTLLATPCSGPFLASALAWTVNQPPERTFAVFTAMGLGMASPYLVVGAFPELLRFIPKPGAWMETFRQVMGFVLLGTVVFLLTFIEWPYLAPTFALLVGVWIACWWIGRIPLTADFQVRLRGWLTAAILVGVSWLVSFAWLSNEMESRYEQSIDRAVARRLAAVSASAPGASGSDGALSRATEPGADRTGIPWRPFTPQLFQELVAARKPIMIDFTADWCLTCKALEATVLSQSAVREAIAANGVVPLKADWTHGDKDVTEMLERLGTKQVPLLAIFPAGNATRPIRLLGGYGVQTVVDALTKAGAPSAEQARM